MSTQPTLVTISWETKEGMIYSVTGDPRSIREVYRALEICGEDVSKMIFVRDGKNVSRYQALQP